MFRMSGYQACMRHEIPAIRLSCQQAVSNKSVARQEEDGDNVPPVAEKLQLDLDKPLRHALEQVFNHQGTVVLTFQGSSYDQVV